MAEGIKVAISKEFLAACQRRYRNLAALILQNVIKQKMTALHGENFIDILRRDIVNKAKHETDVIFQKYSRFYKKYGDEFPTEKMDVSICCAYITDAELVNDKNEKDCIDDLRELRNDDGHEVDPLEDTSEEDKVFHRKATAILHNAMDVFDLPQELKDRIAAYSKGKWSLEEAPKSNEEMLEEANRLLYAKEYEEGFSKIMFLAELPYGPALMRAAELYLTEGMPVEKYNLNLAFSLAERAIIASANGAEYTTEKIRNIISLHKADTKEAYLERAALHKAGTYLPKKWHYIEKCYDAAEKCGWQGKREQLKEDLFDGEFPLVTDTLCKEGLYDVIEEYLDSLGDKKAFAFLDSQDNKENAYFIYMQGLYLEEGKGCEKNPALAREYYEKAVSLCEEANSFPRCYAKACYKLANYDTDDAKTILKAFGYDKRAIEKCNYEESKLRYNLKKAEYTALSLWDEPYKFEIPMGLLPNEERKEFQAGLFKKAEEFLTGVNDSFMEIFSTDSKREKEDELRRKETEKQYKEFLELEDFFSDENELFDSFGDAYTSYRNTLEALGETYVVYKRKLEYEDYVKNYDYDFWANKKRALKEARKGKYESLIGPQSESFWEDEYRVAKMVSACERRNSYQSLIGKHDLMFWEDEDKVNALVMAHRRKKEHEKLLGSHDIEFWKNGESVKKEVDVAWLKKIYSDRFPDADEKFWHDTQGVRRELEALNLKARYEESIYEGYIKDDIWYDEKEVKKLLEATELKEKYENILKNAPDGLWLDKAAVLRELEAAKLKEQYGDKLKDAPSDIWYDEFLVKKELRAVELKEKYIGELPDENPEIWYDEREVMRKIDISRLKEKYGDKLPLEDEIYWKDEKTVLSAIDGIKRKNRYEKVLGEHEMSFWMNEKLVNEEVRKYYRQQKYLSKLGEPDAKFWTLEGNFNSYYSCAKKLKALLKEKNYKEKLTWDFLFNYVYELTEGRNNRYSYHFYTRVEYFRPVEKALDRAKKEIIDSQIQRLYNELKWKAEASWRRRRAWRNLPRDIKDNFKVILVFIIVSAILGFVINGILGRFIESTAICGIISAIAGIFCCAGLCLKKL